MAKQKTQSIAHGGRVTGSFEVEPGRRVFGELAIDGRDTLLYLRDDDFFHTHGLNEGYLKGQAHDLTCLSLFNCITLSGPGRGSRGDECYTFAELFPHHIVHGQSYIEPGEKTVRMISFSIDDGHTIFHDFDAFGTVLDPTPHIDAVANANRRVTERDAPIGPNPAIMYFAGRSELLALPTWIGKVHAGHRVSHRFGVKGVALESEIAFTVEFDDPVDFYDALDRSSVLMRFLELMIGRPQSQRDVLLTIGDAMEPAVLEVHAMYPLFRSADASRRGPSVHDVLINPLRAQAEFEVVMANWIALDEERRDARLRFHNAFNMQRYYTEDRLVAAANMFDILPRSAVPRKVELSKPLAVARVNARKIFDGLSQSAERDSMLSALGRLGSSSLPQKAAYRAGIITDAAPGLVPDLKFVVREAIKCRNHYVHGSPGSFDYRAYNEAVPFFTSTLEFVFGASELIEAGWDIKAWRGEGFGGHSYGELIAGWKLRLKEVVDHIAAAKGP